MDLLTMSLRVQRKGLDALAAQQYSKADQLLMNSVLDMLSVAVMDCEEPQGTDLLRQHVNFSAVVKAFVEMQRLVNIGEESPVNLAGRYQYLVVGHVADLVGHFDTGRELARLALHAAVRGTPFWDVYANTYESFVKGDATSLNVPKLSRDEQYWRPYLDFMAATSDKDQIIIRMRESFDKRNRDKRLRFDAHRIEGTGGCPARWDFRASGLAARDALKC